MNQRLKPRNSKLRPKARHPHPPGPDPIIALLTDFGQCDSFVGQMKGVILGIAPKARMVDLCHEIPAQDVQAAALLLETAINAFPEGAVFLCVIDPGVGSERLPIAARSPRYYFVAPDNGLLTRVLEKEAPVETRAIQNPRLHRESVTSTFHGRDLFAVAAARLAIGFPFEQVGAVVEQPILLNIPRPTVCNGILSGVIVAIDHFGNAASNITASDLERFGGPVEVVCSGISFGALRRYYSETLPGSPIALIDSSSRLEVAVNRGSAANLGITVGSLIEVRRTCKMSIG